MNSPKRPDPAQSMLMSGVLNNQQGQANAAAADATRKGNMINQSTPYGALDYQVDPNAPGGYKAVQSLSAPLQSILNSNEGNTQKISGGVGQFLDNNMRGMTTPLDLSYGANAERLADLSRKTLDPQWARQQNTFDQSMADRGLVPGSQAYDNASRDFNTARSDAYNNMFLKSYDTANQAATTQYNAPFAALGSLNGQTSVREPIQSIGLSQTPTASVQPVDTTGNYNSIYGNQQNAYSNNLANRSAMMGGLFGLGGAVAGGMAGGPMGAAIGSGLANGAWGMANQAGYSGPFASHY